MKLAALLSVSMLASASAFAAATAESDNVFGVLRVDSTAAQTIVSVPWVNAAAGAETGVKVVDLVKTSTLSEGDELYWYNSSSKSYEAWRLNDQKVWVSGTGVAEGGDIAAATDANKALPRGDALILKRTKPTEPGYFFLCGQHTTLSASTSIAVGTCEAPAFTLLAPPTASSTGGDLNAANWSGVNTGDTIILNDKDGKLVILTYENAKWGRVMWSGTPPKKQHDVTAAKIDSGLGVWYKSVGGTAVSVQWN